jgi:hypothetical protein
VTWCVKTWRPWRAARARTARWATDSFGLGSAIAAWRRTRPLAAPSSTRCSNAIKFKKLAKIARKESNDDERLPGKWRRRRCHDVIKKSRRCAHYRGLSMKIVE